MAKRSRMTKRTLRGLARYPVARKIAELGNAIGSTKLLDLAERVIDLESDAKVHNDVCLTRIKEGSE